MARLVVATSSDSDVSGFWTATTLRPAFSSNGITLAQLEPSAQAPCTRTTFLTRVASPSAAIVRAENPRAKNKVRKHALMEPPRVETALALCPTTFRPSCTAGPDL